jgi:hypothetical protein
MPAEPKKPLIVISYAHAAGPEHRAEGEVKWLSFVPGYLRAGEAAPSGLELISTPTETKFSGLDPKPG